MDIGFLVHHIKLSDREIRSLELSYRRYSRLGDISRKNFDRYKDDFLPSERSLALYLFKKAIKLGIYRSNNFSKRFFFIAKRLYRDIERLRYDYMVNNGYVCPISGLSEETIRKELEFRGFIPIEQYKLHKRYGYFITNQTICGHIYIYPKKFADSIGVLKLDVPFYSEYMGKIGLDGITRYRFGNSSLNGLTIHN